MRIEMYGTPWCTACFAMKKLIGEEVEYKDLLECPEVLEQTELKQTPLFFVYENDVKVGEFCGTMPRSQFERRVNECLGK